jgi:hypothetical protein
MASQAYPARGEIHLPHYHIKLLTCTLRKLVLAIWHGTFVFFDDHKRFYGYYLSTTATLLFTSYTLHNVVSWLKIRPLLPLWGSRFFIISLICVQPFWIVEAWSNFEYFNNLGSDANIRTRPFEALLRDPWWIFTTCKLIHVITKTYGFNLWTLVCINRRFGVMLACMALSIVFLLTDVFINAFKKTTISGINPYWRLALVFKCASDTIFLDNFKSVLDAIVARKFSYVGGSAHGGSVPGIPPYPHPHKPSHSPSSGGEFIECSLLPKPDDLPVNANDPHTQPVPKKSRFRPFTWTRKFNVPTVQLQHVTTETQESRKPSHDSLNSEGPMLPTPAHTMYRNPELRANKSDGSLLIGRLS